VGAVDQPVEDGIAECGIANVVVPVLDRELAGDEGCFGTVAILQDFQEITPFRIGECGESPVVQLCGAPHNSTNSAIRAVRPTLPMCSFASSASDT
jgi:hypothetical protein